MVVNIFLALVIIFVALFGIIDKANDGGGGGVNSFTARQQEHRQHQQASPSSLPLSLSSPPPPTTTSSSSSPRPVDFGGYWKMDLKRSETIAPVLQELQVSRFLIPIIQRLNVKQEIDGQQLRFRVITKLKTDVFYLDPPVVAAVTHISQEDDDNNTNNSQSNTQSPTSTTATATSTTLCPSPNGNGLVDTTSRWIKIKTKTKINDNVDFVAYDQNNDQDTNDDDNTNRCSYYYALESTQRLDESIREDAGSDDEPKKKAGVFFITTRTLENEGEVLVEFCQVKKNGKVTASCRRVLRRERERERKKEQ